jgi:hypothetical protein
VVADISPCIGSVTVLCRLLFVAFELAATTSEFSKKVAAVPVFTMQ